MARLGKIYHRRLEEIYHFLINPGQRILEIGCGMGDLLASLQPVYGVGVDFSPEIFSAPVRVTPRLMRSIGSRLMLMICLNFVGRLM